MTVASNSLIPMAITICLPLWPFKVVLILRWLSESSASWATLICAVKFGVMHSIAKPSTRGRRV